MALRSITGRAAARAALALWAMLPGAAQAQCRLCGPAEQPTAASGEAPARPLSIDVEAGIDFSRVAMAGTGGGSIEVDADSGARRVTGSLVDLGGMGLTGSVSLSGDPGRVVRVTMPDRVTLTAPDGSSAEVRDIVTDLPPVPRLGADGRLRFSFGGRLSVNGTVSGNLRGRIPIQADYE